MTELSCVICGAINDVDNIGPSFLCGHWSVRSFYCCKCNYYNIVDNEAYLKKRSIEKDRVLKNVRR